MPADFIGSPWSGGETYWGSRTEQTLRVKECKFGIVYLAVDGLCPFAYSGTVSVLIRAMS